MGIGHYFEQKREDCPECGAKEGAFMCSSEWGHNISCCSPECGQKVQQKIIDNTSKKHYNKLLGRYYSLGHKLEEMRLKGVNGCDPFFKL